MVKYLYFRWVHRMLTIGEPDEKALASCYQSCFQLCDQYGFKSLAIPCVGCGFYGFPVEKSAVIVRRMLEEYVCAAKGIPTIQTVILSVFDDKQFDVYCEAFGQ